MDLWRPSWIDGDDYPGHVFLVDPQCFLSFCPSQPLDCIRNLPSWISTFTQVAGPLLWFPDGIWCSPDWCSPVGCELGFLQDIATKICGWLPEQNVLDSHRWINPRVQGWYCVFCRVREYMFKMPNMNSLLSLLPAFCLPEATSFSSN